jgi:hypothetical protein
LGDRSNQGKPKKGVTFGGGVGVAISFGPHAIDNSSKRRFFRVWTYQQVRYVRLNKEGGKQDSKLTKL